jgi:FKBP-type peptidyl-prolyl cis-trans isomerase
MKLTKITAFISLATLPVALSLSAQTPGQQAPSPQAQAQGQEQLQPDRILEIYGFIVGLQSGIQDFDLNKEEFDSFLKGLRSAQAREEMPKNLEQLFPQLQIYLSQRQARVVEERSRENRDKAEAHFAELEGKEGIQKTEEGLFYKIEQQGSGERPEEGDTVKIHYEGRLLDGTVFDSSLERGEPAEFPLGGVIPGMAQGLQLVQEGGKITLHIPPDLAYGDQSQPTIPPGSALIFEVELIEILEATAGQALPQFQMP